MKEQLTEIYSEAGLTTQEAQKMPEYLDWNDEFYSSSALLSRQARCLMELPRDELVCRMSGFSNIWRDWHEKHSRSYRSF